MPEYRNVCVVGRIRPVYAFWPRFVRSYTVVAVLLLTCRRRSYRSMLRLCRSRAIDAPTAHGAHCLSMTCKVSHTRSCLGTLFIENGKEVPDGRPQPYGPNLISPARTLSTAPLLRSLHSILHSGSTSGGRAASDDLPLSNLSALRPRDISIRLSFILPNPAVPLSSLPFVPRDLPIAHLPATGRTRPLLVSAVEAATMKDPLQLMDRIAPTRASW